MGNLGLDPCGLHFSKSKEKTPAPAQEPVAVQVPATMMVASTYYVYPPMFVTYQPTMGYYYVQQQQQQQQMNQGKK
ncbi:hypothetical protein INT45_012513 [Circinella minor]|uniref:Uncharacterized protein n=1 Tax=Circinella minor TaxID=1195481 RepID=A0A8H7RYV7_9FUNG|nr:hypothetical protein INT45_012513 [Circinella minor]